MQQQKKTNTTIIYGECWNYTPQQPLALQMLSNEKWCIFYRYVACCIACIISLKCKKHFCLLLKANIFYTLTHQPNTLWSQNKESCTQLIFLMLCLISFPFGALAKNNAAKQLLFPLYYFGAFVLSLVFSCLYFLCCNHTFSSCDCIVLHQAQQSQKLLRAKVSKFQCNHQNLQTNSWAMPPSLLPLSSSIVTIARAPSSSSRNSQWFSNEN